MNAIAFTKSASLTMSSQEIAELTGKQHAHVMRDIRAMLAELHGEGGVSSFGDTLTNSQNGQTYPVFNLLKRETLILVSGYSVQMRAAIIDRWQQLEEQVAAPTAPALPDFTNPALAARAWAEQFEARQVAEARKAEIGSRREATAMNTASLAVKKANKLAIELDKAMQYASVKRMEMLHGQTFNWRLLKSTAIQIDRPPIDIFDANYGTVKAYHADVWREAYALGIHIEPIRESA